MRSTTLGLVARENELGAKSMSEANEKKLQDEDAERSRVNVKSCSRHRVVHDGLNHPILEVLTADRKSFGPVRGDHQLALSSIVSLVHA